MNHDQVAGMYESHSGPEFDAIAQAKRLDDRIAKFGRRLLVYTAGPYRDPRGEWYVQQNIRAAEGVARELWGMGFAVICPHKNTANMGGSISGGDCLHEEIDVWLEGDLEMVAGCHLVVMLPGWQMSEGSRVEHRFALELAIPVFYWPECQTRLACQVANTRSISGIRQYISDRARHIDAATGRASMESRKRHVRRATEAAEVSAAPACGHCQSGPGRTPPRRHGREGQETDTPPI